MKSESSLFIYISSLSSSSFFWENRVQNVREEREEEGESESAVRLSTRERDAVASRGERGNGRQRIEKYSSTCKHVRRQAVRSAGGRLLQRKMGGSGQAGGMRAGEATSASGRGRS
eukprot:scaffold10372_cov32-Tisochrysis_lutea.AAC.4